MVKLLRLWLHSLVCDDIMDHIEYENRTAGILIYDLL